jgi:hypothetical protein
MDAMLESYCVRNTAVMPPTRQRIAYNLLAGGCRMAAVVDFKVVFP